MYWCNGDLEAVTVFKTNYKDFSKIHILISVLQETASEFKGFGA